MKKRLLERIGSRDSDRQKVHIIVDVYFERKQFFSKTFFKSVVYFLSALWML